MIYAQTANWLIEEIHCQKSPKFNLANVLMDK